MARRGYTEMGGSRIGFGETADLWSQILLLKRLDSAGGKPIVGKVIGRYWKPVYSYLRRTGYSDASAKDLTQGFFCEVVMGRNLLGKADPGRGRLRDLLVSSLRRYLTDQDRRKKAKKRMPSEGIISLDGGGTVLAVADPDTPEQAFNKAWAEEVVNEAIAEVRQACQDMGQDAYWCAFWHRVLRPQLEGGKPTPLPQLCRDHGFASVKTASNASQTVRRRFIAAVRSRVRQWVASAGEVDQELADLIKCIGGGAQHRKSGCVSHARGRKCAAGRARKPPGCADTGI